MNFECINNKFTNHKISNSIISKILKLLTTNEQKEINSLNIIIEDDEFLRELKKNYFNQDIYTDVITFNLEDKNEPIDGELYFIVPEKCTECVGFHEEPQCAAVCPVDCCVPDDNNVESEDVLLLKKDFMHL